MLRQLDSVVATDPHNYAISQWTYPWTSQYGTRGKFILWSIRENGGRFCGNSIYTLVRRSEKRFLEIPELNQDLAQKTLGILPGLPNMIETSMGLVMAIDYKLRTADGAELKQLIHKTIHRVEGANISDLSKDSPPAHSHTQGAPPRQKAESTSNAGPKEAPVSEGRIIEVSSSGIALSFEPRDLRMKSGERVVIRYKNASDMAHNLVIVNSEADINPVGIAAISAQQDEFIPPSEKDRILAASRLAYPGDTVLVEFIAPGPGVYPYICTFSGHFTLMQGGLRLNPDSSIQMATYEDACLASIIL